jgi:hypothetical protein
VVVAAELDFQAFQTIARNPVIQIIRVAIRGRDAAILPCKRIEPAHEMPHGQHGFGRLLQKIGRILAAEIDRGVSRGLQKCREIAIEMLRSISFIHRET